MKYKFSRLALLLLLAATSLLALTASASAATITVGQTNAAGASCTNAIIFQTGVSSGNSYTVPKNGTLTSWSINGSTTGGEAAMVVFRATGNPNEYTVIGAAAQQTVAPGSVQTFPTNIPVLAGDIVGLWAGPGLHCGQFTGDPGDTYTGQNGFASPPTMGDTVTTLGPLSTARINVSAELQEPANEPSRAGYCVSEPVKRSDGTMGRFVDLYFGSPASDPMWKDARPAVYVQGFGIMCDIQNVASYGGDPSKFEPAGYNVDGVGATGPQEGAIYPFYRLKA